MRKELIESAIDSLLATFGKTELPVADEPLRTYFDAKNYEMMVLHIQKVLCLIDLQVFLGLVNSGGPVGALGWIKSPAIMPMPGTTAFRGCKVTLYLRKSFLECATFEGVVVAIAHEFCHVGAQFRSSSIAKPRRSG